MSSYKTVEVDVDLGEWDTQDLVEELEARDALPTIFKPTGKEEAIFMELQAGRTKLALDYFADLLGRVA